MEKSGFIPDVPMEVKEVGIKKEAPERLFGFAVVKPDQASLLV